MNHNQATKKMQIGSDKRHFSIQGPLSILSALVREPLRRVVNVLQPQKKIFTSLAILLSKIEFFKREWHTLLSDSIPLDLVFM